MGDLGIYFLDVGQGDCTFVVPPDGEGDPILFDCADHVVAERFCANHRIRHLECVIASHLDVDHIRGILPFLENLFADRRRVRRLFVGLDRAPRDESNLTALIEKACAWEREPPHPGFVLEAPDRTAAGPKLVAEGVGWRVELLLPFHGTVLEAVAAGDRSSNRCSAVLRVERDGAAVLVGGDAPLGSWERIEAGRRAAAAIRTPHHGGDILEHAGAWTTYDDLYGAVAATTAVVSVGSANGHHHPEPAHIAAARRSGACRILCTQLTSRCDDDHGRHRQRALDGGAGVEWPYRHRAPPGDPSRSARRKETPCAGNVLVRLHTGGGVTVEPGSSSAFGWHADLVDRVAGPLCRL